MNDKVKEMLERVRASMGTVACVTGKAAQSASKKAGELVESTKLNLKMFDLNTEIDIEYKEIGKLIYKTHTGDDISQEEVEGHLAIIDKKNLEIKEIKDKIGSFKNTVQYEREYGCECEHCPTCGNKMAGEEHQSYTVKVEPVVKTGEEKDIYESDDDSQGI